ncbi:MAG: glycosyltransferase family 2 protein [Anaerolineales bacterium]|nr:glycosyltransferase family 2 protein [Anaerolineales bacterium]
MMSDLNIAVRVSVILVTWNSSPYLGKCLDCLVMQTNKDFEVVIVDNGSTDGDYLNLKEKYSELNLSVKRLEQNSGFASANNIGARLARGEWLALLNADAFPEPDWLERMLDAAHKYPNSFFSSRQIQADNPALLDGEGDVYHVSGLAWRKNYNFPVYPLNEFQEIFSSCAAAALYPCQEFLDAGGFDEDYFSYLEDVDLGFRLRLRGLTCLLVPQALVHHVGSASTGKRSDFSVYHGHRNLVWTYFKDMPTSLLWLYLPLHIFVNIFFLLYFTLKGQGRIIWRAKWDALRGLPGIFKKRREIQLQRKIPVLEIHRMMSRNWLTPFLAFLKRRSG